jgi:hypothetical protein
MNSVQKGDIAELAVASDLVKRGFQVAFPYSTSCNYDLLVLMNDGTFERVQVKYSKAINGVIPVRSRTHSNTSTKQVTKSYTCNEIDWLIVYCPDTDECYYVHSKLLTGQEAFQLRIAPTKNNQKTGVRWAKDYRSLHKPS